MILHRCFAWNHGARDDAPDGPLWFPRIFQGEGRHDNPDTYGCLYLADRPLSCVAEQLAAFRGQRLTASILQRRALPLALAEIELDNAATLVDLDDPVVLSRERLRPSRVATAARGITQPQALDLYRRHPDAAGLRWWSRWESLWANVTVFDRAAPRLRLVGARELTLQDPALLEAADFFGLRIV
ncbi:MAG TPA: RES domain-containing protein [Vicinamibacterales bacterium]|nr:RES domain-containing protein [Vicinamibacterales bacterium]